MATKLKDVFVKDRNNILLKNTIKRMDEVTAASNSRLGFAQAGMNPDNEWARIPGIDPMLESGSLMSYTGPLFEQNSKINPNLEKGKLVKKMQSIITPENIKKSKIASMETMDEELAPDLEMGFTAGDIIGTVGSVVGSVSQMVNTIQNAKATKPVINHYLGFNEKALANNRYAKDQLGYNQAQAKSELQRNIQTNQNIARSRTRGSASGINTLRALDYGVDINANEAVAKGTGDINSAFSQQLMSLLGVDTQLLSDQDKMEMAGQTAADEANAQNLDSFYTNFAQNLAGATTTMQKLGADINQNKYNRTVLKLMSGSNKWGVGLDKDMNLFSSKKKSKYDPDVIGITEEVIPNYQYVNEIMNLNPEDNG